MRIKIGKTEKLYGRCVAMAAAFVLAAAMTALAEDADRFVAGTKINGIGVGNMTVSEAAARIEGFYSSEYRLAIVDKSGKTETIPGTEIGYRVTAPEELSAVLDEQNRTGRVTGPNVDHTHSFAMGAQYEEAALDKKIASLSCVSSGDIIVTEDAKISEYQEGELFVIIPEVQGNDVDPERTAAAIKNAVTEGIQTIHLEEAGCYRTVAVNRDDQRLLELCDALNRCREMTVTYTFGSSSQTLTGDIICTWIAPGADGQVEVSRDQAAAYVKSLADQYDTAGKARVFHTAGGREVTLTGPYGWQLNQPAETDALIAMIREGQSQEREPQYTLTAADRDVDWGTTYAEVDLTGQHAYFFQNGTLCWDAPCVTGDVAKGNTTPEGIYSLSYKEPDRILRGKKMADGTYEYESHVDYWMPFNGGIGFHDASWRGKFGGTIYQYAGSHGCINLPPAKARELYGMISKGMPVLCYQ